MCKGAHKDMFSGGRNRVSGFCKGLLRSRRGAGSGGRLRSAKASRCSFAQALREFHALSPNASKPIVSVLMHLKMTAGVVAQYYRGLTRCCGRPGVPTNPAPRHFLTLRWQRVHSPLLRRTIACPRTARYHGQHDRRYYPRDLLMARRLRAHLLVLKQASGSSPSCSKGVWTRAGFCTGRSRAPRPSFLGPDPSIRKTREGICARQANRDP